MFRDDLLSRAILYPKSFPAGVLDLEALINFNALGEGDERYAMSVASRFLLKSEAGAHQYGCRVASISNGRLAEKLGRPVDHDNESRVYYLGFYDLRFGDLADVSGICFYSVDVIWCPEGGEDVHFHVELNLFDNSASRKQRKRDRREARTIISGFLVGPKRHVCECDIVCEDKVSKIDLPKLEGIVAS